jgi:tripartite-type tricarboxylate transporter receptor subunit TctC
VPSRLAAMVVSLLLLVAARPASQAQELPNKPIHVVIAFPAGGPTDFVGRLVADKVKDLVGRTIIIENKAGANGAIGADYVAKSEPDGTTLFLTTLGAVGVTPHMRSDLPYNSLRDFAPVTLVVLNTTVLVVKSESPHQTLKDLVAAAKAKPGELTWASTGVGSPPHLTLELFQSVAGVKLVHVPYRGAAPALTDLLGGQVQVFAADLPVLISSIKGGKIRALGVASGRRNPLLPDVATLAEQGYPDTVVDNWYGLLAPAKTPPAIIAKLNDAFVKAINDPTIKQKLIDSGAIPVADTPAEFGKFFKAEYERWGKVVSARGIKEGN